MGVGWLSDWTLAPVPCALLVVAPALYGHAVARLHRRGKRWSWRRSASFLAGCAVILLALCSPLAVHDELFPVHMVQHLLVGMLAPLLLALSAPVTLTLATVSSRVRRWVVRLLHSRFIRAFASPPVAALIYVGSMWALYLTPLFAQTVHHPLLHEAMHLHYLLAGCLFMWPLVGLDPMPRRGTLRLRVGVLLFALGSHAALAKLIYAGWLGGGLASTLPAPEIHTGAQIMYYGGDLIDLALLVTFFAQWYAAGGRLLAREQRRLARIPVESIRSRRLPPAPDIAGAAISRQPDTAY